MDDEKCFMTVQQVAKWLNLTPQTIRKMIKEKKIFATRVGEVGPGKTPRYRIPMQSVLEWSTREENLDDQT